MEQLKISVPSRVAVYVSEQKAQTVTKAAMLADDYVLMHKRTFDQYEYQPSYSMPHVNVPDDVGLRQSRGFQSENRNNSLCDSEKFCQYIVINGVIGNRTVMCLNLSLHFFQVLQLMVRV